MSSTSIKSDNTIMKSISDLLTKKNMEYSSTQSEIVVRETTKKEVIDIISSLIEKKDISDILEIVETKKAVYVRKKTNTSN